MIEFYVYAYWKNKGLSSSGIEGVLKSQGKRFATAKEEMGYHRKNAEERNFYSFVYSNLSRAYKNEFGKNFGYLVDCHNLHNNQ